MNLICNNCGGADYYNLNKEEYTNPFIWNCIFANDMIELIKNYDNINFKNIELTRLTKKISDDNKYSFDDKLKICGLKIDNIFTVYYTHYTFDSLCKVPTKRGPDIFYYRNFEYMYNKYNERLERMLKLNEDPKFLIIAFKRHGWNKEKLQELLNIKSKHKVIIITNEKITSVDRNFEIIYDSELDKKKDDLPITYVKKYLNRIK